MTIITKNNEILLNKKISSAKVKLITSVPEDKLVFLKGLVAPFEILNCDLLEDGPKLGLYHEDAKEKKYYINLDHNPQPVKKLKRAKL